MTLPKPTPGTAPARELVPSRAVAEGYIAKVCFKTGPPRHIGVELEWTVHHADDPSHPLDLSTLRAALGDHAPATLWPQSPRRTLPRGGVITLEPGGQLEISSPPYQSLATLHEAVSADVDHLTSLLTTAGLRLGDHGCDPHRQSRRILNTPRYQAMENAFDRLGPAGRAMMCSTAGVQVCLDVGTPERVNARWQALHAIGPAMIATFANSTALSGEDTAWASGRMRTWYDTDPQRTLPPAMDSDAMTGWAHRVLDTELLCLRRNTENWNAPPGVTFADWIDGRLPTRPTFDDLDYHVSTLFPPVRARGYLEVRYLDAQPTTAINQLGVDGWFVPVAVISALFANESTVDRLVHLAAPAADRWVNAARDGLRDPILAAVATEILDLAGRCLNDMDLPTPLVAAVRRAVDRLIATASTQGLDA